MKRALHLFDELRDVVQGKPRFEITEIAGPYLESPPWGDDAPAFQPPAQRLVETLAARRDSVLSLAATSSSRVSVVRIR